MLAAEVIRRKRDGHALSEAELEFLVGGITDGSLSDAQVGALAMACVVVDWARLWVGSGSFFGSAGGSGAGSAAGQRPVADPDEVGVAMPAIVSSCRPGASVTIPVTLWFPTGPPALTVTSGLSSAGLWKKPIRIDPVYLTSIAAG